jgi:pyruvate/2-oxoglutarate dehydrogenase complex dihydrolipoamide dehydrogenase (E3) component
MKAAESAARRGHRVTLVERASELGGLLRYAGRLPGRDQWLTMVADLSHSLEILGVQVQVGVEADADFVAATSADAVVLATGSVFERSGYSVMRPDREGIPGARAAHVLDPVEALGDLDRCGSNVVIVDEHGDHAALGLAVMLANAGRSVELVTHQLFAGGRMAVTMDIPFVYPMLASAGVRLTPQSFVDRIDQAEVTITSMWGGDSRTAAADTVILNMGRSSDTTLFSALADAGVQARRIGDCRVPREVDDSIYEGERCGRTLTRVPTLV